MSGAFMFAVGAAFAFCRRQMTAKIFMIISLFALPVAGFQAWDDEHRALGQSRNDHPVVTIGSISKETVSKDPDSYSNIDIDVSGRGIQQAAPEIVSICRIKDGKCDPDFDFEHDRRIGWRRGHASNDPLNIEGTEEAVAIIVTKDRPAVYFVGRDGSRDPDPSCPWCESLPIGKYKFRVQIKANNSFAMGSFTFDWSGKMVTSNVSKLDENHQ